MIFLTLIEDGSYASKMRSTLFSTREKVLQVQFEKSDKSFQIATVPYIWSLLLNLFKEKNLLKWLPISHVIWIFMWLYIFAA